MSLSENEIDKWFDYASEGVSIAYHPSAGKSWHTMADEIKALAKLGALVRRLPSECFIANWPENWVVSHDDGSCLGQGNTPEEALQQALKESTDAKE